MRLIYTATGKEVQVGDIATTSKGEMVEVTDCPKPHKPSSSGKVYVKAVAGWTQGFYPSVIGAEWIEREDQV